VNVDDGRQIYLYLRFRYEVIRGGICNRSLENIDLKEGDPGPISASAA
jgi:hypothetical protein